jgi:hypothetical protein
MTSPSTGLIELDRDDLTVLDVALAQLVDDPEPLVTVTQRGRLAELHRNVLMLKRGHG